jgi:hypothetical protein
MTLQITFSDMQLVLDEDRCLDAEEDFFFGVTECGELLRPPSPSGNSRSITGSTLETITEEVEEIPRAVSSDSVSSRLSASRLLQCLRRV